MTTVGAPAGCSSFPPGGFVPVAARLFFAHSFHRIPSGETNHDARPVAGPRRTRRDTPRAGRGIQTTSAPSVPRGNLVTPPTSSPVRVPADPASPLATGSTVAYQISLIPERITRNQPITSAGRCRGGAAWPAEVSNA